MDLLKVATFLSVVTEIEIASGRKNNQAQVTDRQCEVYFNENLTIPYTVRLGYICHDHQPFGRWQARLFRREDQSSMDVEFSETEENLKDIKKMVIAWIQGYTCFNRSAFNKEERAAAGIPSRNADVE